MYQVLYRKYRPQVFSEVVGQEHITSTLSRELETGKLSHAYLFTGSRGTGKTTCAKILAKAANCLNSQNGNPCNECDVCRGIDSGAIMDVVEIDAASNNGVDNIRSIREESSFAPVNCEYRVYIIDEVHMLSIGAFNALLKTLEEPPAHVKFILATTEVHKLPVTILSRCQRFDFRRVSPEAMVKRMSFVAQAEGFTLDTDAAILIARLADGGMRDALSILDRCLAKDRHITAGLVYTVAGITGKSHLFELAGAVAKNDAARAVELIGTLHSESCDMEKLCSDLILHFRSLMIAKTVKKADSVLVCTADELEEYKLQSQSFTLESILYSIDLLQNALTNIKRGAQRRIELEMALIKLSTPSVDTSSKALLKRIAALELALQTGRAVTISNEAPPEGEKPAVSSDRDGDNGSVPQAKQAEDASALPPEEAVFQGTKRIEESGTDEAGELFLWPQVLSELSQLNGALWGILADSSAYVKDDFVYISSTNPVFPSFIKTGSNARDMKEAILRATGKRYRIAISKNNQSRQVQEENQKPSSNDPLDSLIEKANGLNINVRFE